jgi:hypothetical protein
MIAADEGAGAAKFSGVSLSTRRGDAKNRYPARFAFIARLQRAP